MAQILPQVIAGLGNPGLEYGETRHNAGFLVVDKIVEMAGPAVKEYHRFGSHIIEIRVSGRVITLAKPQTFMNLSGRAVGRIQRVLGLRPEEMLIIYDCLDLPLGRIRLRQAGGSGGHKGMASIIQETGTDQLPRLRVGIGRADKPHDNAVVDHVLSRWEDIEMPLVRETVAAAAEAVVTAIRRGVPIAMNAFNSWMPRNEAETQRKNANET